MSRDELHRFMPVKCIFMSGLWIDLIVEKISWAQEILAILL